MSPPIDFVHGQHVRYTATRPFELGRGSFKLHKGMELFFDGSTLRIPGRPDQDMPELKGAAKAGWIVLSETFNENDPAYGRKASAKVQIRRADGGNPMAPQPRRVIETEQVESEEREVRTIAAQTAHRQDRNRTNYRTDSSNFEVQDMEGVAVRSVQTPTHSRTNFEHVSPGQALAQAKNVKVQTGEGISREDLMARMDPEERAEYAARVGAYKSAYATPEVLAKESALGRPSPAAGRFQVTSSEDQDAAFDAGGSKVVVPEGDNVLEAEGMVFRTTGLQPKAKPVAKKASSSVVSKGSEDARRRTAKKFCKDFPDNYDFDAAERKKIARIQADFEDRPDVIQAIFAAESDAMKERLLQDYPHVFEEDGE